VTDHICVGSNFQTSAEEHQQEIDSLFAKLSESNAEIETLTCKHQAELSSSHERCDAVERELLQLQDSSSRQIEKLESVITVLNSQVSDITAQLETSKNETRESELKLLVKSAEFEAQLNELSQQLCAVNSNSAQLEESVSTHQVKEFELMQQLCDLKSQHQDEIRSINVQHASEIESIRESSSRQVAVMTERIDSAEAALKESQLSFSLQNEELIAQLSGQYQAQISSLQSEISVLQSKTNEFELQTQDLKEALLLEKTNFQAAQQSDAEEIANLQLMFSESSGKLATAQAESLARITELQQLLQQQTINENAMLDAMRNEHMETSCKLNESLKSAIDSVSELQSKLALAQREVAANQERISDLSANLHATSANLELFKTENSNLKLELQQLQRRVDESSTELCNQKAEADVQVAEVASRLATVQAQFDQTVRDHVQLKSALEIQDIQHAKSISDSQAQSKQLELQIQQLHDQLTTSQSQLHETEELRVSEMEQVKREHERVLVELREQVAQAATVPTVDDDTRAELELVRSRLSEKTSQYHALQKKTTVLETKARVYQQKLEKLQAQSAAKNIDDAENDCSVMNQ
jgi:chromosome segregation ATPase